MVCEDDDPLRCERYLYTLQWTAPGAGVELAKTELAVQPGTVVALGLLAVTLLLAEESPKLLAASRART